MNKSFINKIVKNIIHEVGKDFGFDIKVKVVDELDTKIKFTFIADGLVEREVRVIDKKSLHSAYTVSFAIHYPIHTESDLIQQIICGRIAERLFKENSK